MISLHKSVVKQCKSLASLSRQRGAATAMYVDDSLSRSGKRTTAGSLLDDSSSRRNYHGSAPSPSSMTTSAHEPCYSTFLYHNHPSTPVTVGWVNFDQQQQQQHQHQPGMSTSPSPMGRRHNPSPASHGSQLHRLNPAQQGGNNGTFYGLPYRVDEPAPQAHHLSSSSRAPIVAIEEDDADADDSSVTSASSVFDDGAGDDLPDDDGAMIHAMNRNARRPKNANHGKRPVSRISRREKKRSIGNHRR